MNGDAPADSRSNEWEAALCLLTASLQAIVVFVRPPEDCEDGGGGGGDPDSALRVPFTSAVAFERNGKFAWLQRRTGDTPVQALACGVTSDMLGRYTTAVECRAAAFRLARAAGQDVPAVAEFSVPPWQTGRHSSLATSSVSVVGMVCADGPSPCATPTREDGAPGNCVPPPPAMTTPPPAARAERGSTVARRSAAPVQDSPPSRGGLQSPWSAGSALPVADLGRHSAWAVGDVLSPDVASVAARLDRDARHVPGQGAAAEGGGAACWPCSDRGTRCTSLPSASMRSKAGVRATVEDACLRLTLAKASEDANRWGWDASIGQLLAGCARAVALAEPLPRPRGGVAVVGSHRFAAAAAAPWLRGPPLSADAMDEAGRTSWWVARAPPGQGCACHLISTLAGAAARLHGSFERGPPGSPPPSSADAAATARRLIASTVRPSLALMRGDLVARRGPAAPDRPRRSMDGAEWASALLLSRLADVRPTAWAGDLRGALLVLRAAGCGQQCGHPTGSACAAPSFEARIRAAVQRAKALRDPEWHPAAVAEAAAERGRRLRWLAARQQQAQRALLECELLARGVLPAGRDDTDSAEATARGPSGRLA